MLARLIAQVDPGLVASAGPRCFGFVTGGVLPVALAADRLASIWDQNAFGHITSPAASAIEDAAAAWLLELLGLPHAASVGFVTGGQMANFTCLCAARAEVLQRHRVALEREGLAHAPAITVFVGEQGHITIHSSPRMLGIGSRQVVPVASDAQGRMRPEPLRAALASAAGPSIVCLQAGNVNTRAFDPLGELIPIVQSAGAWVHVDGAFGLWAAAHPELHALLAGHAGADSWAVDGHKWLNVPYDSGFAIVSDARAHHDAMRVGAAPHLVRAERGERDGSDWAPESSRRLRALAAYAALRHLGKRGVAELVARCCSLAQRMTRGLADQAQSHADEWRRDQSSARALRRRDHGGWRSPHGHHHRARAAPKARVGWARRSTWAAPRCASRSRTGPRPRWTSTARSQPSPRSGASAAERGSSLRGVRGDSAHLKNPLHRDV